MYFSELLLNSGVWNSDFIRFWFFFSFFNLKFATDFATDYICDRFCDKKYSESLPRNLQPIFRSQKSQQTTNLIMLNGCAKSVVKFCDRFFRLQINLQLAFIRPKNRSQKSVGNGLCDRFRGFCDRKIGRNRSIF